jgi:tellurite resistance protein TerC
VAHRIFHHTRRAARRVLITIAGVIVILAGVAMLVLPGPGLLTIVLGLMILGAEFEFARRWVQRIKIRTRQALDYARRRLRRPGPPATPPETD